MTKQERFFNVWEISSLEKGDKLRLLSTISLDDDARHVCLDPSASPDSQVALALSSSGIASLFVLPVKKVESKVSLTPVSTISVVAGKLSRTAEVVSASFLPHQKGYVRLAALVSGVKPVFQDVVSYNSVLHLISS
jgi:hypothetical protein